MANNLRATKNGLSGRVTRWIVLGILGLMISFVSAQWILAEREYEREQVIANAIHRLGGTVDRAAYRPSWIPGLIDDSQLKPFSRILESGPEWLIHRSGRFTPATTVDLPRKAQTLKTPAFKMILWWIYNIWTTFK